MLFLSGLVYNLIMTSVSLILIAADLSLGVSFVPSVRSKCLFIVELQWPLYCGAAVASLLWSCSGLFIVELQWPLYCGAEVASLLWSCSGLFIVELQWPLYCGAAVASLLWSCSGSVELWLRCLFPLTCS